MRLTKHRKDILTILEKNKKPMSAELILSSLPENTMDLSTVYRSLDRLHSAGLISKSVINHTAHYFLSDHEHNHFMICLSCKDMFELDCHIHSMVHHIEDETNFKIIQHDLTFYGYCVECQNNLEGPIS